MDKFAMALMLLIHFIAMKVADSRLKALFLRKTQSKLTDLQS